MSVSVAFLAPHTGRHAAAAAMPLAALASRFLRWARPRTAEGGRAAPEPPRGAALLQPEDGPYLAPSPESYPYPELDGEPVMVPHRHGEGVFVLSPDGCIQVRRADTWTRAADTMCDLPVVPRYLDAMPGGTE